ncbi:hypothetical protein FP435_08230 [Lactobacillus sp. PV037]|uniref:hypothetical protein n=1 Tax=unclassified Lactobacillus TaxID=2620435 RepID=UPI00223F0662|nr:MULTISPECIES: hypothetical protein [unclassified Lactobacillus]QNQ81548.1 hypothetical protein FP433_00020 [Lactobacillus sp. PV012]QNQ84404.1 hypothetical protein FP435_08230 [Lactobacillus sp. PV037]
MIKSHLKLSNESRALLSFYCEQENKDPEILLNDLINEFLHKNISKNDFQKIIAEASDSTSFNTSELMRNFGDSWLQD